MTKDHDLDLIWKHTHPDYRGAINGVPVTFMLDTGATGVAIPPDVARRLAIGEDDARRERHVSAMRTWIDLEACDRQGLDVPWGLLASTDRLRRGRPSERPR